jgi:hypothetical protein
MKTQIGLRVLAASFLFGCWSEPPPATAASATPASSTPSPAAPSGADVAAGSTTATALFANAEQVIAEMRPDFKKCYNDGLAKDPKIAGSFTVSARVDAKGAVASVTPAGTPALPADVVTCITTRIQKAQFAPPGARGSMIQIPLLFKR